MESMVFKCNAYICKTEEELAVSGTWLHKAHGSVALLSDGQTVCLERAKR